jgi:sulfonate transport system permease protein
MSDKTISVLKGLALPAILLAAWTISTWHRDSLLFPAPSLSFKAIAELWTTHALQGYLVVSLRRYALGLLLGTSLGFVAGAALGSSRLLERFFLPNFHMFRQVPLVGWIPLLIIWFGLGDLSRIVLIAMGAFFPILVNTHAGFRQVPRNYLEVGDAFGLTRWEKIRRIAIPAALPWIRSGTILSLTFGWTILVASELLTQANGGLSDILDVGRERFRMELVNAGILILGLLGFLFNYAATRFWSIGPLKWLSQNIHTPSKRGTT